MIPSLKKLLVVATAICVGFTCSLSAKTPIQKARRDLERAHSMLTAASEGGKGGIGKNKATIPNIVTALDEAEVGIGLTKKSNGTSANAALKFIAEAKAELEAAKGAQGDHYQKAQKAIEEALKRVMQIIQS